MVEEVGQHVEDGRLGQNEFLDKEKRGRKMIAGQLEVALNHLKKLLAEQTFN